jgi:hypothetical protein
MDSTLPSSYDNEEDASRVLPKRSLRQSRLGPISSLSYSSPGSIEIALTEAACKLSPAAQYQQVWKAKIFQI